MSLALPRRRRPAWNILGAQVASVVIVLLAWAVATDVLKLWPPYVLPGPTLVWEEIYYGFFGQAPDGRLGASVVNSLKRVALGYAIAVALGVTVGAIMAASRAVRESVGMWLTALQSIPSIAWVPLAILWFGLNEKAVLFVVILEGFLPVALAVSAALLNVPPALRVAGRTLGARGLSTYTKVLLPASIPSLTTGLRTGWSLAWRALIGAELLTSNLGLGQMLEHGRNAANMALVLATIIVVGIIGGLFDALLRRAEARVRENYGLEVTS